jgi:16S rRNA (cytidine1402-2'-O)-methyltransferase
VGSLYIVATPIGNLQDLSSRAIETLGAVDAVVCEDTRHTGKLLAHLGVKKPLKSLHSNSRDTRVDQLVALLNAGQSLAYVSDAGTPGVSDPGALFVEAARTAGHHLVPIPGPSALTAILSVAGPVPKTVVFEGFLSPRAGRRKRRLQELLALHAALVLYESPYRVVKLLCELESLDSSLQAVVGRELTKLHEELLTGPVGAVRATLEARNTVKGELVVLVYPTKKA